MNLPPTTRAGAPGTAGALTEDGTGIAPAVSIEQNSQVYEAQRSGRDVIVLSLGEAFFTTRQPDLAALPPQELFHYGDSRGLPELRGTLSAYYARDCSVSVDPDRQVVVTAGSKMALYMALLATVRAGDEVLLPEPYWVSYPPQVALCGATPVAVPAGTPVHAWEALVTPRTKAIVVNSPRNPDGAVLSREEWLTLHALAGQRGITLIADEVYNEFLPPRERFVSAGLDDPDLKHTVIVNSISKNLGLSGFRIGYLLARPETTTTLLRLNQHLITCAPSPLSGYVARDFDELLARARPQIHEVVARRGRCAETLSAAGIPVSEGRATFYLLADVRASGLTSAEFAARLFRHHGVSVVDGSAYGPSCEGFVRVSVGTEDDARVSTGLRRIVDLMNDPSAGSGR
ncbi:pyridoxal phosphate-dependent aminotransferase [Streptomyces sp. ODS05-4]|uniref:pyridoxal phosphate-dependent aminotransferase n=1 Tax=Streptomyces sp. ODS05-4 TaxID=2944939 RepID=UPI00210E98BE|nr:pyridoxal phosphate-dependent aminotransferase [Streptomyces sp. ODS05-4]